MNNLTNIHQSAGVLNTAADLATDIIRSVAGNDVANTINNSHAGRELVKAIVISRIQQKLKLS